MRRRRPEKREILPDPVFNDLIVTCVCNPRIPICNCDTIQKFKFGKNGEND